ncbi:MULTISPECIES: SDR family NAD(P)-dependent oxidoreductase [unclassified Mesorhizobium]|uniref:SDR family NAD(P)-dependent oxidoreductase n=1 Tax=unclassified Mesorhizobium TaxID=325217 RepID=UPI000FD7B750|nr:MULTISPECIES: SDR family NAD(P)-dependent oxidoreductase [unclassified Mesorhizobium]RWE23332.1 MAG: SDR family NAD(P)-dependent oxidoreductase [Mesorhizobium sp.]
MAGEAGRRMRPGAAVVNVASLAGVLGNRKRNAYASSKAGLIALTRSLACAWAARGIRVTAVAPGYVRTSMVAELGTRGLDGLRGGARTHADGSNGAPRRDRSGRAFFGQRTVYITGSVLTDGGWMSFNQPGDAHPPVDRTPRAELFRPAERTDARTVVVTGGVNGIGAAVVRRFAANSDTVVIADKDGAGAAELAGLLGSRHVAKSVDVAVESEVVALFEEVRGASVASRPSSTVLLLPIRSLSSG